MKQYCLASIAENAITATASGTVEMTSMQLFTIVMKLYTLILEDFLFTEVSSLMQEIKSDKLTTALTIEEVKQVQQIIIELDTLVVNIESTIQIITVELVGVGATASAEQRAMNILMDMHHMTMASKVSKNLNTGNVV